jgi:Fe-S-cluster-containing dehydrogenase component
VRTGTLQEYQQDPYAPAGGRRPAQGPGEDLLPILHPPAGPSSPAASSIYPEFAYRGYRWGMVIDLNACIGCGACVVACQAENNVPAVGPDEVRRGREMHWLRVDTYHEGPREEPAGTYFQPVPCMHCEKAPCEVVCPVNATVHSDEGLNDMNYARCIGTRYCSNNCPYKVRRFNYYEYADWSDQAQRSWRNPDVTVRSRGVMEKCTYCVHRINEARIHVQKDARPEQRNRAGEWIKPIYPGELLTACQAVCPTQAIVFGDLNDPQGEIARLRYDQPLNYGLLHDELGTQPRTTYLAALRNRPPEQDRE